MTNGIRGLVAGLVMAAFAGAAWAQPAPADAVRALAPTGTLRAAINYGNPVLAQRGSDGQPRGVSATLAATLARRLGVPLVVVPFDSAGSVTAALAEGRYDVAFVAVDPKRAEELGFTAPYVLIEGAYMVREGSALQSNDDVDQGGVTVAVAQGSAYDLFLSRTLRRATLMRSVTGDTAAAAFAARQSEVLAGVRSPLVRLAAATPGVRLLPGRFMSIEQAMATPKARDGAGISFLEAFLTEAKADGTVKRALAESGQVDAEVAP